MNSLKLKKSFNCKKAIKKKRLPEKFRFKWRVTAQSFLSKLKKTCLIELHPKETSSNKNNFAATNGISTPYFMSGENPKFIL